VPDHLENKTGERIEYHHRDQAVPRHVERALGAAAVIRLYARPCGLAVGLRNEQVGRDEGDGDHDKRDREPCIHEIAVHGFPPRRQLGQAVNQERYPNQEKGAGELLYPV